MLSRLNIKHMAIWIEEFEAFADVLQADARMCLLRVVGQFRMHAIVNLKIQFGGILSKRDVNPRSTPKADTVLEGVLYEGIEQHRGNIYLIGGFLQIDPDFDALRLVEAHLLDS